MNGAMNSKCETVLDYTGNANFQMTNSANTIQPIIIEKVSTEVDFSCQKNEVGKYSIFQVANWFLLKSPMTQKKLQKLCYYAQAWCYALNNYRLVNTDFQAWIHGPASPVLYERFKSFGFDTIKIGNIIDTQIEVEDQTFLNDVWETYGDYTGNALEALSHHETPWIQARSGYTPDERCCIVIDPEDMKTYYRSIHGK